MKVPSLSQMSFLHHLKSALAAKPELRKGDRTREKLRMAAIEVLDDVGYVAMRQSDICRRAEISPGNFYKYYNDTRELMLALVSEYLDFAGDRLFAPKQELGNDPFKAFVHSNLHWIRLARANPGLTRCILQLNDQEPGFQARYFQASFTMHNAIATGAIRRLGGEASDHPLALFVTYGLGAMMDETVRMLFVHQPKELKRAAKTVGDDLALAETLSIIWYRAIYGKDPQSIETNAAARWVKLGSGAKS
jgi:TetR/AcrR family transcriptional regulator, transcriptional repressor for nem operon